MDPSEGLPMKQKVEALRGFSTGPLPSSISRVSGSSRGIPSEKDFHFYYNFDEFKLPVKEIANKSQSMLETIGSSELWAKDMPFPEDCDDAYDWLVNVNDEVFERFDASVDEFKKLRNKEEETGVRLMGLMDNSDDGFQLVYGKKKKLIEKDVGIIDNSISSGVKVVSRDNKTMGTKPKIPFHIPSIRRPQDEYKILVNNANQPFEHVWLQRSEDGSRFIHPLEKYSVLDFVDENVDVELAKPPPVECTQFKLVEEVKDLKELAAKLRDANEFAVDLEHNYYRSFQGLTCLMQISTRTEDFVVDTLKLRIHIGPYLREVFKDPTKKKVMHGADRDIIWLQRDFGIYVVNLFDTGQASRVLKMERNSLEHLLHHFCGVTANKEYQNADWRLRPLPNEMLRYAREDTHYLLHIYDLMRTRLLMASTESEGSEAPLVEVYRRSYDICTQLYEKEVLTESSYLYIYGLQSADFNAQQLAIVSGLCEWRDVVARAEDESTGYILPNKSLLEIARQMPVTTNKLRHTLKSKHPYIERNLGSVVSIIRHSMQNAASFEDVAKQLKEARIEAESVRSTVTIEGYEALHRQEAASRLMATAGAESMSNAAPHSFSGYPPVSMQSGEKSSELGSLTAGVGRNQLDGTSVPLLNDGNLKTVTDGYTAALPVASSTRSIQIGETNASTNLLNSVPGATVQVKKKPSRAFGALLGNSASKRKFDPDKKANEEIKVEQIKSSVNLPFHSFMGQTESSQPTVKELAKPPETSSQQEPVSVLATSSNSKVIILLESDSDAEEPEKDDSKEPSEPLETSSHREPVSLPAAKSNSEDIIFLESDSDAEKPVNDDSIPIDEQVELRDDNNPESVMEKDEGDEPMSLSDLSSNFQKCLRPTNPTRKAKQARDNHECEGLKPFKPFDYEAAIKFGQGPGGIKEAEGDEGHRSRPDKGNRKKNSVVGQSRENERSGDFQPGRRRQAFPVTGNRSATFR